MSKSSAFLTSQRLGLSWPIIILLAALAVPRVITHDLGIVDEGTWPNTLLVFVPLIIWIVVAVGRRVPNPFVTVLVIGICYALALAIGHQVLWTSAMAGVEMSLGGNLADLDPSLQQVVFRIAAFVSSIVTGTVVGAVAGAVAWVADRVVRRAAISRAGDRDRH